MFRLKRQHCSFHLLASSVDCRSPIQDPAKRLQHYENICPVPNGFDYGLISVQAFEQLGKLFVDFINKISTQQQQEEKGSCMTDAFKDCWIVQRQLHHVYVKPWCFGSR